MELFATSHGKGAVDAIGSLVKRIAWTEVKSQRLVINDAFSFYELVKMKLNKIILKFVSRNDIEKSREMLTTIWHPILQTHIKYHNKLSVILISH